MADALPRVAIVGAGLTGAVTAYLTRSLLGNAVRLTVLDKGRGAGGRMSTSRSANNRELTCDLGTQYFTATEDYSKSHEKFYNQLLADGLLKEFPISSLAGHVTSQESNRHYVAPAGSSSIVKHFLSKADASVRFGYHCNSIDWNTEEKCWHIHSELISDAVKCDVVVLTLPVPQILSLQGNLASYLQNHKSDLQKVVYSSRYALGLFFNQNVTIDVPWSCKYVSGDLLICFISIDSRKRNHEEHGTSIVIHTSAPYGLEHIDDDLNEIGIKIKERLKNYLPDLPEPDSVKPQRWRYSQVREPFHNSPGCLLASSRPSLLLGGDAFSHSNFDGCVTSAVALSEAIRQLSITPFETL